MRRSEKLKLAEFQFKRPGSGPVRVNPAEFQELRMIDRTMPEESPISRNQNLTLIGHLIIKFILFSSLQYSVTTRNRYRVIIHTERLSNTHLSPDRLAQRLRPVQDSARSALVLSS